MSGLRPDVVRKWAGDYLTPTIVEATLLTAISRLLQSAYRERMIRSGSSQTRASRGNSWQSHLEAHSIVYPYQRVEVQRIPTDIEPAFTTRNASQIAQGIVRQLKIPASYRASRISERFSNSWSHLVVAAIQSAGGAGYSPEPNPYGHNLYPFPLYRGDMTLDEAISISNVTGGSVAIAAVRPGECAIVSPRWTDPSDCLAELGAVATETRQPNMLLHPLQMSRLPPTCGSRAARTPLAELAAVPLASLRTVRLLDAPFDVKLSANIVLTSERRLIYQMTCQNAPGISCIVRQLAAEGRLPSTLQFQFDVAALSRQDARCAPHLSAIVRERVPLAPNETLIPAFDFWYGRRLALEILRNKSEHEIYRWWTQYCATVIPGPVSMLTAHGLGPEPHLQNSLLILKASFPHRLVLRDLDGVILSPVAFRRWERFGRLVPFTVDHSPPWQHAVDRLVHALFHAHLGEAVVLLSAAFGCSPARLVQTIDDVLNTVLEEAPPDAKNAVVGGLNTSVVKRLLAMALTTGRRTLLFRH